MFSEHTQKLICRERFCKIGLTCSGCQAGDDDFPGLSGGPLVDKIFHVDGTKKVEH